MLLDLGLAKRRDDQWSLPQFSSASSPSKSKWRSIKKSSSRVSAGILVGLSTILLCTLVYFLFSSGIFRVENKTFNSDHHPAFIHVPKPTQKTSDGSSVDYSSCAAKAEDGSSAAAPIPFIGIPAGVSAERLLRAVRSIDHPVKHLMVIHSGEDDKIEAAITTLKGERPDLIVARFPHRDLGKAEMWNILMRFRPEWLDNNQVDLEMKIIAGFASSRVEAEAAAATDDAVPWRLIIDDEISFPTGELCRLGQHVSALTKDHPERALFNFALRSHKVDTPYYNAFAVSASAIRTLGYFDENIYPSHWADNDYDIRVHRAGYHKYYLSDIPVEYGVVEEETEMAPPAPMSPRELLLKEEEERSGSEDYLKMKWGSEFQYPIPFDDVRNGLTDWFYDLSRRECIMGEQEVAKGKVCPFNGMLTVRQ